MRAIILGLSPFLGETWSLTSEDIFHRTGGNTGNMAFQYAVSQHIAGNVPILPFNTPTEVLQAQGDVLLLPLANQLGAHTDLSVQAAILEKAKMPIIGIGLGAQANKTGESVQLSKGTERWLRVIAASPPANGPNICVRGEYTRQVIEDQGLKDVAVVTGCPSNFISSDLDLEKRIETKASKPFKKIAATAGIPFIPRLSGIEQDLVDMVSLTGGEYVVQHGMDMIRLARDEIALMGADTLEMYRAYISPRMSTSEFAVWCHRYAKCYTDIRAWIEALRSYDFVVGTRFHGAMCAIQGGTPAGVIAHDSRTLEMCQTMAIPVCKDTDIAGGLTMRRLRELFPFDAAKYGTVRSDLARSYVRVLESAGMNVSQKLARIAKKSIFAISTAETQA